MSKTRALTGLSFGLAALLLSGCAGAISPGISPGVAATVGDDTISVGQVDDAADHMCTALGDQFRGNGTVVPMGVIRQGTLQLLVLDSQAQQIAEEYGVEAGSTYEREVAQRREFASTLPEEARADYVTVMSANARANAVLDAAGRAKLAEEGNDSPTVGQVTKAGSEIFAAWPEDNGIEVDPRYGVQLKDGSLVPADTSLSVAVSDQAVKGLATEPDPAYTQGLLAGHRCGG